MLRDTPDLCDALGVSQHMKKHLDRHRRPA
jgi:hypothetical protein